MRSGWGCFNFELLGVVCRIVWHVLEFLIFKLNPLYIEFVDMPELQKIQVQYRGKLFSVPIENDNSLRLEHLKTIDQDAIGVVHYNVG